MLKVKNKMILFFFNSYLVFYCKRLTGTAPQTESKAISKQSTLHALKNDVSIRKQIVSETQRCHF